MDVKEINVGTINVIHSRCMPKQKVKVKDTISVKLEPKEPIKTEGKKLDVKA